MTGMKPTTRVCWIALTLAFALAGADIVGAKEEPFFDGLGTYKRTITTDSPKAQRYFNQGLAFYHGFNHGEAIRSFQAAARADPKCAMAHWGIALACGPHINLPLVPPPAAELAWKELALAQQNAAHASPVERDLIEALESPLCQPAAGRPRAARPGLRGRDAQGLADAPETIPMSARSSPRR